MTITIIEYEKVKAPEQEIQPPVQQHKIEVGDGALPGVQPEMFVVTQYHLYPNDDKIKGSAYQEKYLFFKV
jgi:hypothetical protein